MISTSNLYVNISKKYELKISCYALFFSINPHVCTPNHLFYELQGVHYLRITTHAHKGCRQFQICPISIASLAPKLSSTRCLRWCDCVVVYCCREIRLTASSRIIVLKRLHRCTAYCRILRRVCLHPHISVYITHEWHSSPQKTINGASDIFLNIIIELKGIDYVVTQKIWRILEKVSQLVQKF